MPNIDLSILNQRQTPAFYADVFANRPAAGFVGRIFVSTNTFAFYRDNGTSWDLIGGPGTGTVTGTGANGQVTFWNGASTITGSNDLFWDAANGHFGIGTNTPGTALGINHDQNQIIQINQTTATNDTKIAFQNSGVGLWRIGNSYNGGANDFAIYDNIGAIQPVTVKKTTGQVLIGTSTVGAGKLVVASATGDNGVQIVGATSPSLRIDNAEVGATKRIGIGLATAVNNFIQNSQNLDMCIFNSSTSAAGNMLFGIYDTGLSNTQEAARISAARNFLIGTIVDAGQKLQVSGTALITGAATFSSSVTANGLLTAQGGISSAPATSGTTINGSAVIKPSDGNNAIIMGAYGTAPFGNWIQSQSTTALGTTFPLILQPNGGNVGIGTTAPLVISGYKILQLDGTATGSIIEMWGNGSRAMQIVADVNNTYFFSSLNTPMIFYTNSLEGMRLTGNRNLLIGTTTDNGNKLNVAGTIYTNNSFYAENTTNGERQFEIEANSILSQGNFRWRTYGRGIVASGTGTKLNIPFTSQSNINLVTVVRVTVCSADFNSALGGSLQVTFSVGSLNALSNLVILSSGGNYVSATTSGMNVVITQGGFTGAYVYIEYLTPFPQYSIDLGNITLTS